MNSVRSSTVLLIALSVVLSCSVQPDLPKGYALAYGISQYNAGFAGLPEDDPNLTFCDADATAMSDLFIRNGFTVKLKVNSDATKTEILADLEELRSILTAQDLLVFYYSGHGQQADSTTEWIFPFGSVTDKSVPPDYQLAISDSELAQLIGQMPAVRNVVILDSCNSGGFIGNLAEVDLTPAWFRGKPGAVTLEVIREAISRYTGYTSNASGTADISPLNALVISAAGASEPSYEDGSPYFHGILTYFLLDTERNGDLNGDGYVSTLEAFAYAQAQINQGWNKFNAGTGAVFSPHISGGPVDFILFKTR